ncbi:TolB C-terminal domain-containing protein [Penicillium longicatenatum]|uniref:TolB C-terminal domain-containing protein n=1 Tax=Penicillium longicatenatum TaxID=1561947 RepID=UPI0025499544|nr:TolB C-terminal domain-containing protein [Penicillium longicatenatum]KAJ5649634.1 TolB C-terminal domain-containing protein [Penicillium longicatenatum]
MRASLTLLAGLAVSPALAGCPYGFDKRSDADDHAKLQAHANMRRSVPSSSVASAAPTSSSSADGSKGVSMMNRIASGTSNLYIANADGTNERQLLPDPAYDYHPNSSLMSGYFRPAWSPDGEWIVFSSDRNTQWSGHGEPNYLGLTKWETTQELSIYVIRLDGTDFRQIATKPYYCLGSPKWSKDGKRLVYYEMTREDTYNAHSSFSLSSANSTIVSVDVATGKDRKVEADGAGIKVFPQYIDNNGTIAYLLKSGGSNEGFYTTSGSFTNFTGTVRSPCWSPNGKQVVYEKTTWVVRDGYKQLYNWDPEWDYRFTDVFPQYSGVDGRIASLKSNLETLPSTADFLSSSQTSGAAAYNPNWSRDGEWLVFGVGFWFETREASGGWIVQSTANGFYSEVLVDSAYSITNSTTLNNGYPSFSHDGKKVVYRVWGADTATYGKKSEIGLRILDLETRKMTVLTTEWDNLPEYSPDGELILFTRKTSASTTIGANDAHAVWSHDGRIMWSTGMNGFRYECELYDDTFQPYDQIMIMNKDGSKKTPLTDSMWEDSMPLYLPKAVL